MINCANMTSISYTRPLNIGRHPVTCPVIAGSLFTYCWKTIPYSWTNARQCKTKSRICSPDPASYKPATFEKFIKQGARSMVLYKTPCHGKVVDLTFNAVSRELMAVGFSGMKYPTSHILVTGVLAYHTEIHSF